MYRCAIVGVGGRRADEHAEAYAYIPRGRLVAVSTRTPEKLAAFGDRWNVAARYTDYREMFAAERLDLVHVNTPPSVRLEVMEAADGAGIPALVVEKPLAIESEDYLAIRRFAERSRVKVAINHQLHFHPQRARLQRLVHDGALGELRFIDASARMNMAYQGTHTLQAIAAFHPHGVPAVIMGQVAGGRGLAETPRQHVAPDQTLGSITFTDGVSALLRCGVNAPYVLPGDERIHVHKRVAVYGTRGFVHWTMWSWETGIDGRLEGGRHEYSAEDVLGQAALTEAMFDWLEDAAAVHPLNLHAALSDFDIVLRIYMSALQRRSFTLADESQPRLIEALRAALGNAV